MSHKQQIEFCESVKTRFPQYFKNTNVLDVGSLDINGNNRYLFDMCKYIGVDIIEGTNVDFVTPIHLLKGSELFDVVISTEMLEHDIFYIESIKRMCALLKKGGLLLITCATTGRKEHGTRKHEPQDSPATNRYYENVTKEMLFRSFRELHFIDFKAEVHEEIGDLYFWGIKE